MKNYDQSVELNHNLNWLYISDYPYRILIFGGSGSGKTNVLLNLIKYQRPDFDKIYLYVKESSESKYQLLINGREKVGIKKLKIQKYSLIIHKQLMIKNYSPTKKRRVLIVFVDMTADMKSNKTLSPFVTVYF